MEDLYKVTCTICKHARNSFGNFVECELMQNGLDHVFVDWHYWNNERPKECPLIQKHDAEI